MVVREVERAATAHLGRPWVQDGFSDLNDRASHPCGIFHGRPFSVFAKLGAAPDANEQFTAELRGLRLLRQQARVATAVPVATGLAETAAGSLLLHEALPERPPEARTGADFEAIGRALAMLHQVHHLMFGIDDLPGFFGPLPQDNRPVPSNRWADFYAERRVRPHLRIAVDSGHLPPGVAADAERLIRRLPGLCGPEPRPSLLHGDAQQNNFVSLPSEAAVIDPAPYFGHPELDLALVGYFRPVPREVFGAYQDLAPIDPGFGERRELWRIFAYLAVVAADGSGPFGRPFLGRLTEALHRYR